MVQNPKSLRYHDNTKNSRNSYDHKNHLKELTRINAFSKNFDQASKIASDEDQQHTSNIINLEDIIEDEELSLNIRKR
jgi:hypothetical protein